MKLSKKIKKRIFEDNEFSLDLAKRLGIRQDWVFRAAKNNGRRLLLPDAMAFYRDKGFSDDEILSNEDR